MSERSNVNRFLLNETRALQKLISISLNPNKGVCVMWWRTFLVCCVYISQDMTILPKKRLDSWWYFIHKSRLFKWICWWNVSLSVQWLVKISRFISRLTEKMMNEWWTLSWYRPAVRVIVRETFQSSFQIPSSCHDSYPFSLI